MSSSKLPPGLIDSDSGSLSAFERWELPAMGEQQKRVDEVNAAELAPPTAEQIEEIQKQARSEGFEQGRREGLQAARSEVDATLLRMEQIIQAMAEPLLAVEEQVEGELLQLAIAIARQIIRRDLQVEPEQVVSVVREALAALPSSSLKVRIQLHPEDAQIVREKLIPSDDSEQPWKITDDLSLTRGGCIVEGESSRIDASVEKRLNSVIAELMGGTRSVDNDES